MTNIHTNFIQITIKLWKITLKYMLLNKAVPASTQNSRKSERAHESFKTMFSPDFKRLQVSRGRQSYKCVAPKGTDYSPETLPTCVVCSVPVQCLPCDLPHATSDLQAIIYLSFGECELIILRKAKQGPKLEILVR